VKDNIYQVNVKITDIVCNISRSTLTGLNQL